MCPDTWLDGKVIDPSRVYTDYGSPDKPADYTAYDEPIEINERGGKGSDIGARYLDCPMAIHALAAVLKHGERRYDRYNWRKCDVEEHLNHAVAHIYNYVLDASNKEEELSHALCRVAMAYEMYHRGVSDEDCRQGQPVSNEGTAPSNVDDSGPYCGEAS